MDNYKLKIYRRATGLSIDDFAFAFGVKPKDIEAYEAGTKAVDNQLLSYVAWKLCLDKKYFERVADIQDYISDISLLDRSVLNSLDCPYIDFAVRASVKTWLWLKSKCSNMSLPKYTYTPKLDPIRSLDDIDDVAAQVREDWNLQDKPIKNMVKLFEDHGIIVSDIAVRKIRKHKDVKVDRYKTLLPTVFVHNFEPNTKPDNSTQEVIMNQGIIEVVQQQLNKRELLNSQCAVTSLGDTQVFAIWSDAADWHRRLILAKALGYIILKDHLPEEMNIKQACERFAREFMLPKMIVRDLYKSTNARSFGEFGFNVHITYGVDPSIVIERCTELGIINHGIRTMNEKLHEVLNYPEAKSNELADDMKLDAKSGLFMQFVIEATQKKSIIDDDAAHLLNITLEKLDELQSEHTAVTATSILHAK